MTSEKLKALATIKSTALVEILQQVAGLGASASALYWSEQNDDIHLSNMDERLDKIEVALIQIRQSLQVVRGQPEAPAMRVGEGLAKATAQTEADNYILTTFRTEALPQRRWLACRKNGHVVGYGPTEADAKADLLAAERGVITPPHNTVEAPRLCTVDPGYET